MWCGPVTVGSHPWRSGERAPSWATPHASGMKVRLSGGQSPVKFAWGGGILRTEAGGVWRAVYDNRVQQRALEAMREAQASRRPAARPMQPMLPAALPLPAEDGDTGAGGAAVSPVPALPAEGSQRLTARGASPPVCGPVRPDMLLSADEAARSPTPALRSRWSQVYGRACASYNLAYLRKACTAPGMNVRRKRAPTGSGGAVLMRQAAAMAMARDDADEPDDEEEGDADELSDCGLSDEYSVYDSESDGEVGRLPLAEDRCMVRRKAQSVSSGDELCSEDEREVQALIRSLARKRKAASSRGAGR